MKRLTSALLALLLSLMLLPTAVMAAEPAQQGNSDSITYINPLYEGVVTEDDHLTWEEARALDVQDGLAAAARSSDANATTNAGTYTGQNCDTCTNCNKCCVHNLFSSSLLYSFFIPLLPS